VSATVQAPAERAHRVDLGEEFEHEPVPSDRRRGPGSVSAVWFGFPMILTNAVFGGVIVYGLGFAQGVLAMVLGSLVLMVYVGALSYLAGRTGRSFALTAIATFGRRGYALTSGFLATVVIGQFAFQTGLTGAILNSALGWDPILVVLLAGVIYIAVTFVGIRGLAIIGVIAAPLYVVLGSAAVWLATRDGGGGQILAYPGQADGPAALSLGAAMAIVIAGFIDSGTMTADFTRWPRSRRSRWPTSSLSWSGASSSPRARPPTWPPTAGTS